ncbi:endonuclease/exonuclease/phosphatase family protein [Spirillospora sp. NPDC029432]|uniref:endonuclease/exonuclease/phosphatase family protein n=1 Tax=Spirillospora sp. NPDC029432 TaxID=3154599 RepID=UPI0034572761
MRAPRALIPLLAVCGAAAVVATAGAGAAIELDPDARGPALADAAEEVPPATVNAMTWNVCGDTGCPLGTRPDELVKEISQRTASNEVGGRRVRMNAVLLQEVCSGHVDTLRKSGALRSWSWTFAPMRSGGAKRTCANGQGEYGVAVGAESALSEIEEKRLPSPDRHGRSAVCGTVAAWQTRLCSVQLSSAQPDDDPGGAWRGKQIGELAGFAEESRVIVGGDFTERPESPALDPLYRDFAECDQGPGESRTGALTQQGPGGTAVAKTSYLFISKEAGASCGVSSAPVAASDHRPLAAAVRFR